MRKNGSKTNAVVWVLVALFGLSNAYAAGNSGITYHGRIIKPDGEPLEGEKIQFKLQIRTAGSENCLLFEEVQTLDMRKSAGVFAITLNDGSGTRSDSSGYNLDKVFANRGTFSIDSAQCTVGTGSQTTWSPNNADGRKFQVYFKTESAVMWEPLPSQMINFAPMAIEAKQVGGFAAQHLLRVEGPSGPANAPALSPANATELMALVGGTSALYTKAGQLNGIAIPTSYNANESIRWNGTTWEKFTALSTSDVQTFAKTALPVCAVGEILTSDGTVLGCVTDGAGAIGDATTTTKGLVAIGASGGIAVSGGTLSLATTGVAAGTYTKVSVDVTGRVLTGTTLVAADIPSLDASKITSGTFTTAQIPSLDASKITTGTFATPGMVSGNAITSGTIGGSTALVTSGAVSANSLTTKSIYVWDSDTTNNVQLVAPATGSLTGDYVLTLPTTAGSVGQVLQTDGSGNLSWVAASAGSVTNVGLTLPSIFSVTGGPVTSSGTFNATLASQSANTVFAAPDGSAGTPSFRSLASGDIPSLDASKVSTGTFAASQIPSLDASKVTTGTFASSLIPALGAAQIPNLDASKITTGTFATGLIPDLDAAKITTGTLAVGRIPGLDASNVPTGTFASSQIPVLDASKVGTGTFTAAQIPSLDASKITTGTLTNTVRNTSSVGTREVDVYDSDSTNKVSIVTPATGSLTADYTLTLPVDDGAIGQVLTTDGAGVLTWSSAAIGSVTSVDVNLPSIFTMAGGPITSAGTISATLASQAANSFWAAPNGAPGAPTFRAMVAADVPSLDAAKITTGTFAPSLIPALGAAQIPNLDASKITTGTFAPALIPDLDAAKIATGTLNVARIPDLDSAKTTSGTFAVARIPALDASNVPTGTFAAGQIPSLDASKISTGTITNTVRNTSSVGTRAVEVYDSDSTNKVTIVTPATGSLTADYTLTLPSDDGTNGQVLTTNGTGALTWSSAAIGSVTSVDVNLPSIFTMAGGPITAAGTISATLASQAANSFWAAPNGAPGAPTFRAMVAADIPALDAAKITTGTFTTAQIPDLDSAKIASGTLAVGRIPDLDAAKIASGTLNIARIPDLDAAKTTSGTFAVARIPALDAAQITTGTFASSLIPALGAAQIPNLDASKITTGTFSPALIPDLDAAKITSGTLAVGRIPALDASNVPTGTFAASQIPVLDASKVGTGTFTAAQIPSLDASKIATGTITNVIRNTSSVGTRSVEVYDSDSTNKVTIVTPATGSLTADYTLTLPVDDGTNGQVLTTNGSGALTWSSAAIGSVTSVDVNLPSIFTMAGGPITAAGTISATLASQAANSFWAAPNGAPGAPTFRAMVAADIPVLDAAKITTGTFTAAQIPDLDSAKIATGTLNVARIPDLDSAKIASGTLNVARIPDLDAAKTTSGTFAVARIPALDAAQITTGTFASSLIPALGAAQIPNLDASKITTGTFSPALIPDLDAAKIASGTLAIARIPALDAAKITTGTFATAQIPALDAAKITSGTFTAAQIPTLDASKIGTGTFTAAQIPALDASKTTTGTFASAQIPALDASKIATGTITNTVNNTTFVGSRSVQVFDSDSTNKVTIQTPATGSLTSDYVLTLPVDDGTNGQILTTDGNGVLSWVAAGGAGTVTNVGLALPNIFSVAGGPVTTNGTFTATLASQTQNTFWAAPNGSNGAPTFRAMVAADVPVLDAAKITTGSFGLARIPDLDASKTVSGTFSTSLIPALDAAKITTGSFAVARIPDLDASKTVSGTFLAARIPDLDAAKITTGSFALGRIPDFDASKTVSGTFLTARIPDLDAAKITTGSFGLGRIPDFDASKVVSGTFLTARIPDLDAAKIATGSFALARIPDFDASKTVSGTFLSARIPDLDAAKITTGSFNVARIPDLDAAKVATGTLAVARIPALDANKITTGTITNIVSNTTSVSTRSVQIFDSDSSNKITLQTPATGSLTSDYVLTLPVSAGTNGQILSTDGSGNLSWTSAGGGGTVTNVGLALPNIFSVSGGPVTTNGTFSATLATQTQNTFWAAPNGSNGAPTFRAMVAADVPVLDAAKITTGTFAAAQIPALDAGKITSGTFTTPGMVSGAAITSGTIGGSTTINTSGNITSAGNIYSGTLIAGQLYGGSSVSSNLRLYSTSASGTTDFISLHTANSSERMRIDTSGNVGIGTTAPATKLDVNGSIKIGTGTCGATTQGSLQFTSNSIQYCNTSNAWTTLATGSGDVVRGGNTQSSGTMVVGTNDAYPFALETNGTSRLHVDASGNVGIGAVGANPLHVERNQNAFTKVLLKNNSTGSAAEVGLQFENNANTFQIGLNGTNYSSVPVAGGAYIWNDNATPIFFGVGGTEVVRMASGGNVGIGTTNPAAKLDVNGIVKLGTGTCGASTQGSLQFTSNSIQYCNTSNAWTTLGTGGGDVVRGGNTQGSGTMVIGTNDVYPMAFEVGGTSRMFISAAGRVGINVSNPTSDLDVDGQIGVNGNVFMGGGDYIVFNADSTATVSDAGISFQNGGSEIMRMPTGTSARAGRVGIGTTAPETRLDVNGSIKLGTGTCATATQGSIQFSGGNIQFCNTSNVWTTLASGSGSQWTTNGSAVGYTGPVGIGTTSPLALELHVADPSGTTSQIKLTNNTGSTASDGIDLQMTNNDFWIANNESGRIDFQTTGTNRLTILPSGNVGIGTTNPGHSLAVAGSIASVGTASPLSGALLRSDTSNGYLDLYNGGTVYTRIMSSSNSFFMGSLGIGTTAPTSSFDVRGAITAGVQGTATGQGGEVRFQELAAGGSNYVALRSPDALGSNITLTLPTSAGTLNQVLTTDGSGALSWTTPAASSSGTFLANNGTAAIPTHSFTGDPNNGMYLPFADSLGFSTGGTNRMVIDSSGNVGVGTTSPGQPLDVVGIARAGRFVANGTINNAGLPQLTFNSDSDTGLYLIANDILGFSTGGANRLVIDSSGNVGIGLTNPSHPLHLQRSGYTQATLESSNDSFELDINSFGTGKQSMMFLTAARGTKTAPTYLQAGDGIGYIGASPSQGGRQAARIMFNATATWSGTSTPGNIIFATTPVNATVPVSRAEITDTGVFTIAGGAPSTTPLLDVNAPIKMSPQGTAAGQGGEIRFQELAAQGTNYVALRSPDTLGSNITLTLPTSAGTLNQVLTTDGSGALSWTSVGATSGGTILAASGSQTIPGISFNSDPNVGLFRPTTDTLAFTTGGTERMRITASGNVGIGGTSPDTLLYVDETTTSTVGGWDYTMMGYTKANPVSPSTAQIINSYHATEFQGASNSPNAEVIAVIGDATNWGSNTLGQATSFQGPVFANNGTTNLGSSFIGWAEVNNGATMVEYRGLTVGAYVNSGTLRHSRGIFIDDLPGTQSQYGIYQNGSTDMNYFNGSIGIGTTNPATKLDVNGTIKLGTGTCSSTTQGSLQFTSNSIQYCNTSNAWTTLGSGGGDVARGGNTQGSGTMVIGTNDAYPFALETNGVTRVSIGTNGNVAIGTTNPALSKLHVVNSSGGTIDSGWYSGDSMIIQDDATAGTNLFLDLVSGTSGRSQITMSHRNGGAKGAIAYENNTDSMWFHTNAAERMRINNTGNIGIGNTNPGYKVDVSGDLNLRTGFVMRINGTQICSSAGCTSSSDMNLKENVTPLEQSLEKILSLQGVEYDWKDKSVYGDQHQIGLIAQDLEKVYPEVVVTDEKTGLKSVAYDHLIAPIIEAIKTLYAKMTDQSREIASLKAEVETQKAKNEQLEQRLLKLEQALEQKAEPAK